MMAVIFNRLLHVLGEQFPVGPLNQVIEMRDKEAFLLFIAPEIDHIVRELLGFISGKCVPDLQ